MPKHPTIPIKVDISIRYPSFLNAAISRRYLIKHNSVVSGLISMGEQDDDDESMSASPAFGDP
jgi:hypothetical protein